MTTETTQTKPSLADERRMLIEAKTLELFSTGPLSLKIDQAFQLTEMRGLDLFSTALSWTIAFPDARPIDGFSETLRFAASDIYSHLMILKMTLPLDTPMTLTVGAPEEPRRNVAFSEMQENI